MEKPDFSKIFASNSALSAYTFSDADYLTGWSFIGSTPPARTMFDAWMRQSDTKMKWLHDNALYDSSLEDVLFWRMPLTTYAAGARRCLRNGPLGVYLLCIIAGTTDANVLSTLPTGSEVGNIFIDGSVTWQVMQHASTTDLSEHASANDAHAALFADKQPLDATLTALAGVASAADKIIYATGEDKFTATALTEFARSLIDDPDAATMRNTLGAAPLVSPVLTGMPTAPTASAGTNDKQIATTEFVKTAVSDAVGDIDLSPYAKSASPALTGMPTAPTASVGTNDKQIATTEFVKTAVSDAVGDIDLSPYARLASPALTGMPTAPTAAVGTATTQIATMAALSAALQSISTAADVTWADDGKTFACESLGIAGLMDTNGYISLGKLFGGLILQWGTTSTISQNMSVSVNLPVSFDKQCLGVYASRIATTYAGVTATALIISNITKSSFNVSMGLNGGSSPLQGPANWISIGI